MENSKNNINTMINARNDNAFTNTELWDNEHSKGPIEYTYILTFNDCSPLSENTSYRVAWDFIKRVATTGHTFGRNCAGSIFFTSTWDIDKLATVFEPMKMEFILFCANNHATVVRINKMQQDGIYNFFKTLFRTIPVK